MGKDHKDSLWFQNAIAISIGVVLFTVLWKFPDIWSNIMKFINFFKPVIMGCILAYLVSPLANWFDKQLARANVKKGGTLVANILAFSVVLLVLINAVIILLPQLVNSIKTFADNLDGYMISFRSMVNGLGIPKDMLDIDALLSSSGGLVNTVIDLIKENMDSILSVSASAGRGVLQWGIAFIISMYLIAEKASIRDGFKRLLKAIFGQKYKDVHFFLSKCDEICSRYIVFSLIDAIIIGALNAIFMAICGMEYIGLISVVVGITNLIPTFGPVIGCVIGGFVLLMVNPVDSIIFVIFTIVLQACDGYVIKPKLFGNTLGVSGLWILIGVVVGGNMFGVAGILLAIPGVAILDFIYKQYIISYLENRSNASAAQGDRQA